MSLCQQYNRARPDCTSLFSLTRFCTVGWHWPTWSSLLDIPKNNNEQFLYWNVDYSIKKFSRLRGIACFTFTRKSISSLHALTVKFIVKFLFSISVLSIFYSFFVMMKIDTPGKVYNNLSFVLNKFIFAVSFAIHDGK